MAKRTKNDIPRDQWGRELSGEELALREQEAFYEAEQKHWAALAKASATSQPTR